MSTVITGCDNEIQSNALKFSTSAEYPPFEYCQHGEIKGFDIELAQLVAHEMGKEAIFENMQFSAILAALQSGAVDAAISTISITPERQKNFDFSDPYYAESMATVFIQEKPVTDKSQLSKKKIACQLGTTMEIWLKKYVTDATIIAMDNNTQVIEALKAGHVDVALMDGVQGAIFSQKNTGLSYAVIARADAGYGVAFKKGSRLKESINKALKSLAAKGEIEKLKQKWLEGHHE
jgi:polar amino acid transport system substrate-binding protein